MSTISTRIHVGVDGILRLEVPVEVANSDVDVSVVVSPIERSDGDAEAEHRRKFVERTAGKWAGEKLIRPDQGYLEHRLELE